VDDPEGYHVELQSDARSLEDKLDLWLVSGAERFRRDPELKQALLAVARHADSRRCLLLLNAVIDTPGLVDRLFEVLGGQGRDTFPQGLKPPMSQGDYGTAKAVPLQSRNSTTVADGSNPHLPKPGRYGPPSALAGAGKKARQ
jgi:hypothetical protein